MDSKRYAIALAAAAVFLFFWNTVVMPPPPRTPARPDSAKVQAPAPAAPAPGVPAAEAAAPLAPARTVVVRSPLYEYRFSTRGGALQQAELLRFRSYTEQGGNVRLVPRGAAGVFSSTVTTGSGTVSLAASDCQPSAPRLDLAAGSAPARLTFTCPAGTITYTFRPDRYLVDIDGRLPALAGGQLTTSLGTGLAPHDAPEHGAERELSLVGWTGDRIERLYLRKVRGVDTLEGGAARWAGFRDRYFFLALINQDSARFRQVVARDLNDETYVTEGKTVRSPRAEAYGVRPLGPGGAFRYQAYLGPLEHAQLEAAGHELEEVNPYGYRWLRPVVRPIAAAVLWILRELHDGLGIAYGWVLIIFGVMMRLVTWPLNARAMRSQMKNMAVQPQMQARMKEIQGKYANDPRKQQEEMMKMYQELGVNPLSMMSGCLPLLIPMPVLITLFFVFQGAVEFRGTPFAWLPDLSLTDPWYILPIFLMASMFGLQWVSTKMSGMEETPQTRMMLYTMPLMMGIFFWWMPSGLNLYYATTNVASLPQQLLIARERRRATEAQKAKDLAARKAAGRPAGIKPGTPKRRNG